MEVVLIFMALALYLIWGDASKPPAKPKPQEKWVETDRKRTTVIEERPVKSEKK